MRTEAVLLHDWLTGFRGGERVLESFCDLYPEAPLYTLLRLKNSTSPKIERRTIHTSFLNSWPGITSHYRKFLPLMPLAADRLRIREDAEVVLSSHHCVIKGVRKPPGAVHVSYVHSPMRYMYDQYENYFGRGASWPVRLGGRVFRSSLVRWDRASNQNVDLMIANSRFVQKRIRDFYGIESEVVHPFVELADFEHLRSSPKAKEDFFVMVTAFAPNKRVDLAVQVFNKNGRRLKVIGGGQQDKELRAMAEPNVEFLGQVGRDEVVATLAKARALVFPGVEDFGITPLEALAAGTPVIAYAEGGVMETLTEEDSVFFTEPSTASLQDAVERFDRASLKPNWERLQKFSKERFLHEISGWIRSAKKNFGKDRR